jgi:hypothetical protein
LHRSPRRLNPRLAASARALATLAILAATLGAGAASAQISLARVVVGGPISALPNENRDWTITVEHFQGSTTITSTVVDLAIPTGWSFQGTSGPACAGSTSIGSGTATWTLGNLSPGTSPSCTFVVQATPLAPWGSGNATGSLSYITDGGTPGGDTESTTFTALAAIDLVTGLSLIDSELTPGETTTMTVAVSNQGNAGVVGGGLGQIQVTIDKGVLTFGSGNCRIVGGKVEFTNLPAGGTHQCDVEVAAPAGALGERFDIVATATPMGTQPPELFPADDTTTWQVRIAAPLELDVTITQDEIDDDPGDGVCSTTHGGCSLRAAIMESNAWPEDDLVRIPPGDYFLTRVLGATGEETGDLDLLDSVELVGEPLRGGAPTEVRIHGLDDTTFSVTSRVFEIDDAAGVNAVLRDLIVRGGEDSQGGGMRVGTGNTLTLEGVTFFDNHSSDDGGGLWARSPVSATDVLFEDNTAQGNGAGMNWTAAGVLEIVRGRFEGNRTTFGPSNGAGGLHVPTGAGGPEVYISESVFHDNRGYAGGALSLGASTWITNTTISGNAAVSQGGGLRVGLNTVRLAYSTVAGNDAGLDSNMQWTSASGEGGGIWINTGLGNVRTYHTVVTDNRGRVVGAPLGLPVGADCFGTLTSDGTSVVERVQTDTQCSVVGAAGDLLNTDPQLDPFDPNSGVHRFADTSPLVDLGETSCVWDDDGDTVYDAPLAGDQLGGSRPVDGDGDLTARCDPGAWELRDLDEGLIFSDGLESGDVSAWASSTP